MFLNLEHTSRSYPHPKQQQKELHSTIAIPAPGSVAHTLKRKNLTTSEKRAAIAELPKGINNGALRYVDLKRVASLVRQQLRTTSCLWKEYIRQEDAGVVDPDLPKKRKGNSGQKGIDLAPLLEALRETPLKNRTTQRSVTAALAIPQPTLFTSSRSSAYMHPRGTPSHCSLILGKKLRLEWALRWIRSVSGGVHKFHHFETFIH